MGVPRAAVVVAAPSPLAGEGSEAIQRNGLGEGATYPPHPTVLAGHPVLPSPARGEGAIMCAELAAALTTTVRLI